MKHHHDKPYDHTPAGSVEGTPRDLVGILRPLRVELVPTSFGCCLNIDPTSLTESIRPWVELAGKSCSSTLLYGLTVRNTELAADADAFAETAFRMGLTGVEAVPGGALLVQSQALPHVITLLHPVRLSAAQVSGPIEESDVDALKRAEEVGKSPLDAEMRARIALRSRAIGRVELHLRDQSAAPLFVAECLRHYLAARLHRLAHMVARPELWQIERLLSLTGILLVRPVETEVFSTSADVGISTHPDHEEIPADRSLIYDLPSNTWHDEA